MLHTCNVTDLQCSWHCHIHLACECTEWYTWRKLRNNNYKSVIYYENEIWQHFMLCSTDLLLAFSPAQFVRFLLPMKLLQTLLPCWLQYLKIWTFMMVTISSWWETNFYILCNQLSPHLLRYVLAKFRFHQQSISWFIIINFGPLLGQLSFISCLYSLCSHVLYNITAGCTHSLFSCSKVKLINCNHESKTVLLMKY
jgi:hypothetical protein